MDLENFPLKISIFPFFALCIKKSQGVGLKNTQDKDRVSLLLTEGQKYAGSVWVKAHL